MARGRFDNLDPARRETILAAAAEEFIGRGYGGASLNRILRQAGISKGQLYYYFDDKEDLFVTTVQVATERLLEGVGGVPIDQLTDERFWATVRQMGLKSIQLMGRGTWDVRLVMAFPRFRQEPEAQAAVRPTLEWGRSLTVQLLAKGRELGVVRKDLPLDFLVEATMALDDAGDRWMVEHADELDERAQGRLIEGRISLLRSMLDAQNEGWR